MGVEKKKERLPPKVSKISLLQSQQGVGHLSRRDRDRLLKEIGGREGTPAMLSA